MKTPGIFNLYKTMFHYQKLYPFLIILLLVGIAMGVIYECVVPLVFKWLFNDILNEKNTSLLFLAIAILGVSYIFLIISSVLQTFAAAKLGSKVIALMRFKMFKKIQYLKLEGKDNHYESNLIQCFTNDINFVESMSVYIMWSGINYIVLTIVGTVLLFYFNWIMTLIVAIIMPLSLILPRKLSKKTGHYLTEKKQEERSILTSVQESITMQDVIRLHLLKGFKRKQFKAKVAYLRHISYRYSLGAGLTGRSAFFGINFIKLLVLSVGGYLVCINYLTAGQLIGFIILLGSVNSAINSLSSLYPILNRSAESLDNIEALIAEPLELSQSGSYDLEPLSKGIEFKNISVGYDNKVVLNGLGFMLPAGKTIAFVGPSGAGKSTILKLILKELDPIEGHLFFDGVDYRHISTRSLLSQIGVVMQQPKLFEGNILENIRMGKLNASMAEIIDAAKRAGIHHDIMNLPEQYNTLVGKRNAGLSGGQCQRVAIARALIANPAIICLDEATSALDPFSSNAIEEEFLRLSGNHTIICITHRLHSVIHADQIIVLDEGCAVESGTHEELLTKNGLYSRLWKKQHGFIMDKEKEEVSVIPDWLRSVPLFESLPDAILEKIAKDMLMERADKDSIIITEGTVGDKLYIIVVGMVEILVKSPEGEDICIAKLSDGDFFGEISLLYNVPHNATVKTTASCIFLSLHHTLFQTTIARLREKEKEYLHAVAKSRMTDKQRDFLIYREG